MNFILLMLVILYLFCTAFSGYCAIKKLDNFPIPEAQRIHRYRFSLGWNLCSRQLVKSSATANWKRFQRGSSS